MNIEGFEARHDKYGDVMFLDVMATPVTAEVDTQDVGDKVGFPGQIVVRYDANTGEIYGVIVEGYSAVAKKLKREQAMHDLRKALAMLIEKIKAALTLNIQAGADLAYA